MSAVSGTENRGGTRIRARRLLAAVAAIAVAGIGVHITVLAGLSGWHPDLALAVATSAGTILLLAVAALCYRHITRSLDEHHRMQSAEARLSQLVESAMDAIIVTDEEQNIVLFNPAAEQTFGWPSAAVIGKPLDMLIPEAWRRAHREHVREFGRTGATSRRMAGSRVVTGLRANGEEFPIDASISQHSEGGRKFFTVILRDVTRRVRAQEALQRAQEELAMASQLAREQEKSRIARELHDELMQDLTALKMDIEWLRARLPQESVEAQEKLERMRALLDSTVAATRRIAADLRPLILDELGLVPAVEWLVQNFSDRTGIAARLTVADPSLDLREPHASALFRVLQESLTNVARHSGARQVDVTLGCDDGAVTLNVRDDGGGFLPKQPGAQRGYGLIGMHERMSTLGGELKIESAPGQGTRISARVPLPRAEAPRP